jgi:hypothetical protein
MIFKGQIIGVSADKRWVRASFPANTGGNFDFDFLSVEPFTEGQQVTLVIEPDMDLDLKLAKAQKYDRLHSPEVDDFIEAVRNEALHQRERWTTDHDGGKTHADWFWLVGYLAGKALHALMSLDFKKGKHHIITTAAALLNWHGAITGNYTGMRPGTPTKE